MLHPKIQVRESFKYISDGFRAEMNQWLIESFGYEEDQPYQTPVVQHTPPHDANVVTTKTPKSKRTKALCYEHSGIKYNTLSELLENLDNTFKAMKFPDDSRGYLDKESMRGLRKLGVHVPSPWLFNLDATINTNKGFPALMSVALPHSNEEEEKKDFFSPHIFYAVRRQRLPPHVTYAHGTPYFFGETYLLDGRMFWMGLWLVVKQSGEVVFCKTKSTRYSATRVKGDGLTWIPSKSYEYPGWIYEDRHGVDETLSWMKAVFINLLNWWVDRDDRWNVVVKKGKDKVTFGVAGTETKLFFADRDTTVMASDGKRKRIIHYVRSHERVTNEKAVIVKEHIRGIREFDWNGYHCIVTAPGFNGATSSRFNLPPVDFDSEHVPPGYIGTDLLGQLLGALEEGRGLHTETRRNTC